LSALRVVKKTQKASTIPSAACQLKCAMATAGKRMPNTRLATKGMRTLAQMLAMLSRFQRARVPRPMRMASGMVRGMNTALK